MRGFFHALFLGLCCFALLAGAPVSAAGLAQAGSAQALIEAVNAYRSANGLAPYAVDGGLMSEAQSHSEYQASIQTCTHQRADGSGPGDHGISAENIACGLNLSVEGAIYRQWTDVLHSATILGPDTGLVGAGVASANGSVYYTLAVRRLSGDFTYRPPVNTEAANTSVPGGPSATPRPTQPTLSPLLTATPLADGAIQHTIGYGQTLVQIAKAYGITLEALLASNPRLDPKNPVYYEFQVLIIRQAFTATPTASITPTPLPPTRTATVTRAPTRTAIPSPTRAPLLTPTATPWVRLPDAQDPAGARKLLAIAVITASGLGLLLVLARGFWRSRR